MIGRCTQARLVCLLLGRLVRTAQPVEADVRELERPAPVDQAPAAAQVAVRAQRAVVNVLHALCGQCGRLLIH